LRKRAGTSGIQILFSVVGEDGDVHGCADAAHDPVFRLGGVAANRAARNGIAMLHFAYASNMSRQPMRMRCPTAVGVGLAALRDHRFVIMANGYASVTSAPGEGVHGLLWRLGPRDLAALDAYEDVAGGLYRRAMLPVMTDKTTVSALVYLGCETRQGRPRPGYMPLVLEAARECGLPENYVASLARFAPGAPR
jgi:gamma-glutamylcyclotransferase (GGCT)/AIG2-like uncharacterized protein YtfP